MIEYIGFSEQLIALTGRPDLPVAPYLMKTLATISRSGEFAEDMVSITYEAYHGDFYDYGDHSVTIEYRHNIAPAWYYSLRRLLSARITYNNSLGEFHDLTVASSTTLEALNKLAWRCPPNKGIAYMADGTLRIFIPKAGGDLARVLATGTDPWINLVLSTSNEKRAWAFCPGEVYRSQVSNPWVADDVPTSEPTFADAEGPDYIWQMNAFLDLVLYGTAASQLRFAGHERESQLLYGEFLTGLRQFKADRDNQLASNEGALGF